MLQALIDGDANYLANHREHINEYVISVGRYQVKTPLEFIIGCIGQEKNDLVYHRLRLLIDNGVDLESPMFPECSTLSWAYRWREKPLIELLVTYGNVNPYTEHIPKSLRASVDKSFWNHVKQVWLPVGICLRHISAEEQLCILEELIPGIENVSRFKKSLLIITIKHFKAKKLCYGRFLRFFRCCSPPTMLGY